MFNSCLLFIGLGSSGSGPAGRLWSRGAFGQSGLGAAAPAPCAPARACETVNTASFPGTCDPSRTGDVVLSPSTALVKALERRLLWAKHHSKEMEKQQREGMAAWRKIKGLERMAVKKVIRGN